MSTNLHRRLSAMEAASAQYGDFTLIRVMFVAPGKPTEPNRCRLMGHPEHFVREPSESEDGFMDRVRAVALANRAPGQRVAVALMSSAAINPEGE